MRSNNILVNSDLLSVLFRLLHCVYIVFVTGIYIHAMFLDFDLFKLSLIWRFGIFCRCPTRATKFVKYICHLNYEEILHSSGLPTLEFRDDRNDMIQVYRALCGFDDIKCIKPFTLALSNTTRGDSFKLFWKQCRTSQRLHSFTYIT